MHPLGNAALIKKREHKWTSHSLCRRGKITKINPVHLSSLYHLWGPSIVKSFHILILIHIHQPPTPNPRSPFHPLSLSSAAATSLAVVYPIRHFLFFRSSILLSPFNFFFFLFLFFLVFCASDPVALNMANKRPFDEVGEEGSSKHQRQDGPSDEISLCDDSFSVGGACGKHYVIGESSIGKEEFELHQDHENVSFPVIPKDIVEDVEIDVPRSASLSHWATSSTSDDDELPEELVQLPLYPGYFSFDHPVRPVINPDDVYYCQLDYPPRKCVPVGTDFQADIPCCGTQINANTSEASGRIEHAAFDVHTVGIVEGGLAGICVMPFPKIETLPCYGDKIGNGRTECMCPDQGSVRCVRQHIAEARDELRRTIGQDTFVELGFYDMGEVVAEKWSVEEEQLFHEVVYSNPASLGKNFWNVLSAVFPSRTKMEIVSYYFNVFMLRKRAEQNRCDPFNIDSDNDEWHGSDDDGGDEGGVLDEDEDSGIETPVRHDGLKFHQNGLHLHGDVHGLEDDGDLSDKSQENCGSNVDGMVRKTDHESAPYEYHVKKPVDDDGETDVQDGSCTSSDSGAPVQGSRLKPDGCHDWNEYVIDLSDAKVWDGFSLSFPTQNVDFLPTCSMIEEVFGEGGLDSKSKRW